MKAERRKRIKTNIIGDRVILARERQRLTRNDLLMKLQSLGLNMSLRTLSLLERRKRRVTDKEVVALAMALNVSVNWLFGVEDEKTDL